MQLVICGLGYCGTAVARAAAAAGYDVIGTHRTSTGTAPPGIREVAFAEIGPTLATATHLLITAAPEEDGDPLLLRFRPALEAAGGLRWIGYFSTTGVYGDRAGGWVDEDSVPAPAGPRTRRRVAAEQAWRGFADRSAVDIMRLAGIYGPGRSVLDDLRAGTARRIIKPGHCFGRIHRDDIVHATLAAMAQGKYPGARVLNFVDDEPAESATVISEGARLLGLADPPGIPFAEAEPSMRPMARQFWSESRRVSGTKTKASLGIAWTYPSWREGLAAILTQERIQQAEQATQRTGQQREVGGT